MTLSVLWQNTTTQPELVGPHPADTASILCLNRFGTNSIHHDAISAEKVLSRVSEAPQGSHCSCLAGISHVDCADKGWLCREEV